MSKPEISQVVVRMDEELKRQLKIALLRQNITLKDWVEKKAKEEIKAHG